MRLEERAPNTPDEQRSVFHIDELYWTDDGKTSKADRMGCLQPDFENSRFYLPALLHSPDLGVCSWGVSVTENKHMIGGAMQGGLDAVSEAAYDSING
jgi:hypothetical protein